MGKTTTDTAKISAAQQAILDTRKPCPVEPVSRVVMIHVYDPEREIEDKPWMNTGALNDLTSFYNGLKDRPGTDAHNKAILRNYTFEAHYYPRGPTAEEREKLGRMDFPFYIAYDRTGEDMVALMDLHLVSPTPKVQRIDPANPDSSSYNPVEVRYGDIENSWPDQITYGYGMPGEYFVRRPGAIPGLGNCRKLGIIKLQALNRFIASHDLQQSRLATTLRHELGHMFGMAHFKNTLMSKKFEKITDTLINQQLRTLTDTLKKLSPL